MSSTIKRWWDEKRRWIFFVCMMKKSCLRLCIWFWWRGVIVRVWKITKMTLKTVLSEKRPLWPASRPLYTRNRARFSRFLQTLRVGALRSVLLFLAAPRRVRPLLTTEKRTLLNVTKTGNVWMIWLACFDIFSMHDFHQSITTRCIFKTTTPILFLQFVRLFRII